MRNAKFKTGNAITESYAAGIRAVNIFVQLEIQSHLVEPIVYYPLCKRSGLEHPECGGKKNLAFSSERMLFEIILCPFIVLSVCNHEFNFIFRLEQKQIRQHQSIRH